MKHRYLSLPAPARAGKLRPPVADAEPDPVSDAQPRHAALWRRFAAALVDAAIIGGLVLLVGGTDVVSGTVDPAGTLVLAGSLAMFYRVLFEGSRLAATPGKLAVRLRVTDLNGGRLTYATAAARAWPWWLPGACAGIAPSLVPAAALACLIAAAFIPLSATRRGLHDRMAGTVVVDRRTPTTREGAPQE